MLVFWHLQYSLTCFVSRPSPAKFDLTSNSDYSVGFLELGIRFKRVLTIWLFTVTQKQNQNPFLAKGLLKKDNPEDQQYIVSFLSFNYLHLIQWTLLKYSCYTHSQNQQFNFCFNASACDTNRHICPDKKRYLKVPAEEHKQNISQTELV